MTPEEAPLYEIRCCWCQVESVSAGFWKPKGDFNSTVFQCFECGGFTHPNAERPDRDTLRRCVAHWLSEIHSRVVLPAPESYRGAPEAGLRAWTDQVMADFAAGAAKWGLDFHDEETTLTFLGTIGMLMGHARRYEIDHHGDAYPFGSMGPILVMMANTIFDPTTIESVHSVQKESPDA